MSEIVGSAQVEIHANTQPLEREVAGLGPTINKELDSTAKATDNLAVKTGRARVAGFGLRTSFLGLGVGLFAAAQGVRALSESMETADGEVHSLSDSARNFGARALRGDFIGAIQAANREMTLTSETLQNFQANFAAGKTAEIGAWVDSLKGVSGAGKVIEQIRAAQAQTRANLQSDAAAQASISPDLQDDLAVARQAEREAQIGLRLYQKGTDLYSKSFQGYAAAVAQRRKVQEKITKETGPGARDAGRDAQFQLNILRAQSNKNVGAEKAILQQRKNYLRSQISNLESEGTASEDAKSRLTSLYGQLKSVSGDLTALSKSSLADRQAALQEQISLQQTELQIVEANARTQSQESAALAQQSALAAKFAADKRLDAQTRSGFALQAAQLDKQIFQANQAAAEEARRAAEAALRKKEEERKQAIADAKAAKERALGLREARLQLRVQRSELTRSTTDDKKAQQALIKFYGQQAALARKSGALAKAVEFESRKVGAQLSLRNLGSSTSGGPQTDFFKMAAEQFNTFGSNIGGRSSILSGQDARGAFAGLALGKRGSSMGNIAGSITGAIQATGGATVGELAIQTQLLVRIVQGIGKLGNAGPRGEGAPIDKARSKARNLGAA